MVAHAGHKNKHISINMSQKLRPISDYMRKKELSKMLISAIYIKIMEIAEPFCKYLPKDVNYPYLIHLSDIFEYVVEHVILNNFLSYVQLPLVVCLRNIRKILPLPQQWILPVILLVRDDVCVRIGYLTVSIRLTRSDKVTPNSNLILIFCLWFT